MKLYYSPGACSMAPHIVLHETGLKFETEKVDLKDKRTSSGADYMRVNPKGYVPALQLDDGQVLTEVAVICQYLADQKPESGLAPRFGTMERYREMEWISFISTEIHKTFSPLWNPNTPEETKQNQRTLLATRLDYLAGQLKGRQYLMGENFTVADAYLYTVLNWSGMLNFDLARWPILEIFMARVGTRASVVKVLESEGLAK